MNSFILIGYFQVFKLITMLLILHAILPAFVWFIQAL